MGKSKKKMKSLPEDVIISILAKLDVKPLMRFRCVCKWWYHLIKSPNFIEMHQRSTQNKKNECILINLRVVDMKLRSNTRPRTELSFYSYESLNKIPPHVEVPHFNDYDTKEFQVSWPCNGLLLCVSEVCISYPYDHRSDYRSISVLFNPATRESKLLPPSPLHVPRQNRWDRTIGLGFDSNQNDYKVITIEYEDKAQIYNLSSNSWRQIEHDMPYIYQHSAGVPFNGALHWPANRNGIKIIFSFDVSTEVFKDINLPESVAHYPYQTAGSVTLLNDCLAVLISERVSDTLLSTFVDIWVMKVVGSWTKHIRVGPILVNHSFVIPHVFWKNEALLFHTCRRGYVKMKLWALDTHQLTETEIIVEECHPPAMLYKESLVSIN